MAGNPNLQDRSDDDISMVQDWSGSMMANSARETIASATARISVRR